MLKQSERLWSKNIDFLISTPQNKKKKLCIYMCETIHVIIWREWNVARLAFIYNTALCVVPSPMSHTQHHSIIHTIFYGFFRFYVLTPYLSHLSLSFCTDITFDIALYTCIYWWAHHIRYILYIIIYTYNIYATHCVVLVKSFLLVRFVGLSAVCAVNSWTTIWDTHICIWEKIMCVDTVQMGNALKFPWLEIKANENRTFFQSSHHESYT